VLPEAEQQTMSGGEGGDRPRRGGAGRSAAPGSLGLEW